MRIHTYTNVCLYVYAYVHVYLSPTTLEEINIVIVCRKSVCVRARACMHVYMYYIYLSTTTFEGIDIVILRHNRVCVCACMYVYVYALCIPEHNHI